MSRGEEKARRWTLSIQSIFAFMSLVGLSLSMFLIAFSEQHSIPRAGLAAVLGCILGGSAIGLVVGQLWLGTRVGQFRGALMGGLMAMTPVCGWLTLLLAICVFLIWRIEKRRSVTGPVSPSARSSSS